QIVQKLGVPFVVTWWAADFIILPPKYLADLRGAEWGHLNFFKSISDAFFLHTTVGDLYSSTSAERIVDVVNRGLNPCLPMLTPVLLEEINYGFQKELGTIQGWKEIVAFDFFSNIAHRNACRIIIGDELCRDEEFLQKSMNFIKGIFINALVIVKLPLGPLRPSLAWLISLVHRWQLRSCERILLPVLRRRLEARNTAENRNMGKLDAMEWTFGLHQELTHYGTLSKVSKELLHTLWAGSSAPGGMMTEILYQLLLHPQHIEPLREEARKAIKEDGWSEKMLSSLLLQDSFIREVNRLFPTGSITCVRVVCNRPFVFSDGLTLPVGTRFGFPAKAIQRAGDTKFKGFRFAQSSQKRDGVSENTRRWSAASMATDNLAWGYGTHVCPGRFLAVRELKLIFTKLLTEYEFKWDKKDEVRPSPVHIEGQFIPNMQQKIFLKRRHAASMS
ncbi:cytochrome P450, partial [Lentithecium fluviatile CBS 122367]